MLSKTDKNNYKWLSVVCAACLSIAILYLIKVALRVAKIAKHCRLPLFDSQGWYGISFRRKNADTGFGKYEKKSSGI